MFEKECGIGNFLVPNAIIFPLIFNKSPSTFKVFEVLPNKQIITGKDKDSILIEEPGLFHHAILSKSSIDTPGAISLLVKKLKIPPNYISYAGLKDAEAETHQRISLFDFAGNPKDKIEFERFIVHSLTRARYEVNLGDLFGNHFQVQLDLTQEEESDQFTKEIANRIQELTDYGFPNYFGLQRFGASRPISHIVGKFILQGKYREAVEAYLTTQSSYEDLEVTETRRNLAETGNFKEFLQCLPKKYQYEINLAQSLQKQPNNYRKAFNTFPNEIKKLFLHSYQSYIFNRMVSTYLQNSNFLEEKGEKNFPLINADTKPEDLEYEQRDLLVSILDEDDISLEYFANKDFKWFSNKNHLRKILVKPRNLSFKIAKSHLDLEFTLSKGSYATMLIRELTHIKQAY